VAEAGEIVVAPHLGQTIEHERVSALPDGMTLNRTRRHPKDHKEGVDVCVLRYCRGRGSVQRVRCWAGRTSPTFRRGWVPETERCQHNHIDLVPVAWRASPVEGAGSRTIDAD
jgi:hypothetical protein